MLPSGTLLYSLTFKGNQKIKSEFGDITSTLIFLFKCRAAKVKQQGKYLVDAKELFHSDELKFKLRNNKLLNELLIVEYLGYDYKITSYDLNLFDNTVTITIDKINKK